MTSAVVRVVAILAGGGMMLPYAFGHSNADWLGLVGILLVFSAIGPLGFGGRGR